MVKEKAETIFESKDAFGIKIAAEDCLEIVSLEIKKNGEIATHELPVDICFFINDGGGELCIENEKIIINKGEKIVVPFGKKRSWKNIGSGNLIITGIKYMIKKTV